MSRCCVGSLGDHRNLHVQQRAVPARLSSDQEDERPPPGEQPPIPVHSAIRRRISLLYSASSNDRLGSFCGTPSDTSSASLSSAWRSSIRARAMCQSEVTSRTER